MCDQICRFVAEEGGATSVMIINMWCVTYAYYSSVNHTPVSKPS